MTHQTYFRMMKYNKETCCNLDLFFTVAIYFYISITPFSEDRIKLINLMFVFNIKIVIKIVLENKTLILLLNKSAFLRQKA